MTVTFVCANCGERMVVRDDQRIPDYCPWCGAHKRLAYARKSRRGNTMTYEERIELFNAAKGECDEKYKEFCLAYGKLFKLIKPLYAQVAHGKITKDMMPKMPRINVMSDSRYFMELEDKNAAESV